MKLPPHLPQALSSRERNRRTRARWAMVLPLALPVAAVHAVEYLSIPQAQAALFPAPVQFEPLEGKPTAEQLAAIEALAAVPKSRFQPQIWKVTEGGKPVGFFLVDNVIGKHDAITFALGLDTQGSIQGLEILNYRENYGGEVRFPGWRGQFKGKRPSDLSGLGTSIRNISGATLSCSHLTEAVKRLLAWYEILLKG